MKNQTIHLASDYKFVSIVLICLVLVCSLTTCFGDAGIWRNRQHPEKLENRQVWSD